jgi:hypothetical protein
MARENFLWGAPRIHGELLMLGFSVSQATVSRYLPAPSRWSTQSWRTFLRNQASASGQYSEERSSGYALLNVQSYWAKFMRSAAAQIATVRVWLSHGLGHQQPTPNAGRIRQGGDPKRALRHASIALSGLPLDKHSCCRY